MKPNFSRPAARRWTAIGLSAGLLLSARAALAQPAPVAALLADAPTQPAANRGPEVIRLTVHAKATTRPALQYRLLPDAVDRTHGNAAPVYFNAFLLADNKKLDPVTKEEKSRLGIPEPESDDRLDFYLYELPLEKLPRADVERTLSSYTSVFDLVDIAARREQCEWDLTGREQGFQALLPHLNVARQVANVTALRTRLLIARKDYPGAVRSLQTLFALGRDIGNGRQVVLIDALVGAGITSLALREVRMLAQQPDAPNLYWPLATLPRPLADMRSALAGEKLGLIYSVPAIRQLKTGRFTADDWTDVFDYLTGQAKRGTGLRPPLSLENRLGAAVTAALVYPQAKQALIDQGVSPAEVEAMPVPAVVGRYQLGVYEQWWDEETKWAAMPYWQAHPGMQRAVDELGQARETLPVNPFLLVAPGINRAIYNGARLDRDVAAIQTVEALRHYAATHDGRPPAKLEDLTDAPAPFDPMTGKLLGYAVDGDRVTLTSPAPEGNWAREGLRMEITFVR